MYAAPPPTPHPGHHHRPPGIHQRHYRYPYVPSGGQLSCAEIPNPVAGAVPSYVWVNPLTGETCVPYLPAPLVGDHV